MLTILTKLRVKREREKEREGERKRERNKQKNTIEKMTNSRTYKVLQSIIACTDVPLAEVLILVLIIN